MTEKDLLLKLFLTNHLNVPERRQLPNGVVRKSIASELIKNLLVENGWFPGNAPKPEGNLGGEYYQLEVDESKKVKLHHNYECSFHNYDHKVHYFNSVDRSITAYLKFMEKKGLDGIKIDWES